MARKQKVKQDEFHTVILYKDVKEDTVKTIKITIRAEPGEKINTSHLERVADVLKEFSDSVKKNAKNKGPT